MIRVGMYRIVRYPGVAVVATSDHTGVTVTLNPALSEDARVAFVFAHLYLQLHIRRTLRRHAHWRHRRIGKTGLRLTIHDRHPAAWQRTQEGFSDMADGQDTSGAVRWVNISDLRDRCGKGTDEGARTWASSAGYHAVKEAYIEQIADTLLLWEAYDQQTREIAALREAAGAVVDLALSTPTDRQYMGLPVDVTVAVKGLRGALAATEPQGGGE